MAEIPQLKGIITKDMVKQIGSKSYAVQYVPWSKIAELMQQHAPGWMPEVVPGPDGDILCKAPVGGYLQIRFVHLDGTKTPCFQQAVQDNRHNSIPYEKITSRDLTDTQRRGWCLAAAAVFGIGVEMWTRDPLESGYAQPSAAEDTAIEAPVKSAKPAATEETFRETALEMGVNTTVIDLLVDKLGGNYESGLKTLAKTTAKVLNSKYGG